MSALIDQPAFQALLPWAKAWAEAEVAPKLTLRHVLLAAEQCQRQGQLPLSSELAALLQVYATQHGAAASAPKQPSDAKRPVSDDLRIALAHSTGDLVAWLSEYVQLAMGKIDSQQASATATPSAPPAPAIASDPVLDDLMPWLVGAMRHLGQSALSAEAIALALQASLRAGALDRHVGFAHWVEGHLDELSAWLSLRQAATAQWQHADKSEVFNTSPLDIDRELQLGLTKLHTREHAPSTVWKWAQATVQSANDELRRLQVAYHEAGHALALHVLSPETVFASITIQPEGNSGGHVATTRNTGFEQIYLNSLEHALESIVILLAGRAAEVRQFGQLRADSGAVSDIQKATGTAWTAITSFGLDPDMGMVSLAAVQKLEPDTWVMPMANQGWLNDLAQQRLHTWLRWGHAEAASLVEACWPLVDTLALALMRHKTLDNDQARAVFGRWQSDAPPYRLRPLPSTYLPLS